MVLGVCRRVLAEPADAEDAFQATFLVFVRKVRGLADPGRVGAWLYGVAVRTAREARARRAWRRKRERQADPLPDPPAPAADGGADWRPLLDEEIHRLPEKYRTAVVLCELQGRSRTEAAEQLGVPEGTLSSRLARARGLLRRRLVRRGLTPAVAGAAALLPEAAPAAAPALITNTTQAALAFAAGPAGSAGPAALAEGVLRAMTATRIKTVAAFVLTALAVMGGGAGLFAFGPRPAAPTPLAAAPADDAKKEEPPPAEKKGAGLSARLVAPKEISADDPELKAELVLTNDGDAPVRVCTLCGGSRSGWKGHFEEVFSPDWWKSDRSTLERSAREVVTLKPGKSISFPIVLKRGHYKDSETFTIAASYAVEEKAFIEKLELWAGKAEAEPVAVKVRASDARKVMDALEKLGATFAVDEADPAKPVVYAGLDDDKIGDADLAGLRALPDLRKVRLGRKITDAGMEHLRGLVELRELDVLSDGPVVTDKGLDCLKGMTKLERLNLNHTGVSDEGLKRLGEFSLLRSLGLFKTRVTDAGLADLRGLDRLEFLDLGGTAVTDEGLPLLSGLPGLQALYLNQTAITDDGVAALKRFPALGALNLEQTKVTDAGLADLQQMDKLQKLYLAYDKITDDGAARLAKLDRLAELDLSRTGVTDDGLAHLKGLRLMAWLMLNGTKITDAGLAHLKGMKYLHELDVIDTPVTEQGADELRKALPEVRVLRVSAPISGLHRTGGDL
jgi:RNA polymerase sigma factor (sigma-70 family)